MRHHGTRFGERLYTGPGEASTCPWSNCQTASADLFRRRFRRELDGEYVGGVVLLGLRALILVAGSIADGVRDVIDGMAEVEQGRIGRTVHVYEQSEIGVCSADSTTW